MEDEDNPQYLLEFNTQNHDEKVKISSIGDIVGTDGRAFKVDAKEVVKNIKQAKVDISLNENHWGSRAFGWFSLNSIEVKDDGIYASLALNDLGEIAVKNRHYRYLSPEYMVDDNRNVINIVGVGLVNQPNLLTKALNKQETKQQTKKETDDMTELETLKEQNSTLQTNLEAQQKITQDLTDSLKLTKVDNAISSGSLLPASKEFALSLEINQIDSFIATQTPTKLDKPLEVENNKAQSDSENAVFAQLGVSL